MSVLGLEKLGIWSQGWRGSLSELELNDRMKYLRTTTIPTVRVSPKYLVLSP